MESSGKMHWDHIYKTRSPDDVSWTQLYPKISLDFIHSFPIPKSAGIIDIGGGDSRLVDILLSEGYENITVLDISAEAIKKVKKRLGKEAKKVTWIVDDILRFHPQTTYNIWHDRATFHFLTDAELIKKYIDTARSCLSGYMVIGTFSDQGPKKCSGLEIRQYNEETMSGLLNNGFDKIRCVKQDHVTPFNTLQNFIFCSFKTWA
jgi:hypothetical protein